MHIYFGKVEQEYTEDTELFEYRGNKYYYKLEMQDDQFVLHDTCGRSIPFDLESAKDLYRVVKYVYEVEATQRNAREWVSQSLSKLGKFYGINVDAAI